MDNQNKEVKMSKKCLNCKFWKADDGEKEGLCRKYAPRPSVPKSFGGDLFPCQWPKTSAEDWCGEFEKEKVKRSGVFGRGEKE